MTSKTLVRSSEIVVKQEQMLLNLLAAIESAEDLDDLTEARARVEAVRAWAKVHSQIKGLRLQLLAVEVEALVRVAQLDGLSTLSTQERKAAQWLAEMTVTERAELVRQSASATTASGMCRAAWREAEVKSERNRLREAGIRFASKPEPPDDYDRVLNAGRSRAKDLSGVLADIADNYIETGTAFTVDELADEIIESASIDTELANDEDFVEGVREVCRRTLTSPSLSIAGTAIPRMITVCVNGTFTRIPTVNATMAHFDNMIALRYAQWKQDRAALQRLEEAAQKLKGVPGGENSSTRIGDLLAKSLRQTS